MKTLLIATTNPGKIQEISGFLKDLPVKLVSLRDVGIFDDVEETGDTYSENSKIKAVFYAHKSGLPAVSDDGGLEIAALGGAPGVKSKRWVGENATDQDIISHMIKVARELPDDNRFATFRTVVTLALPNGDVFQEEGTVEGIIAEEPFKKILTGYPYRSFFYLPALKKFYHETELTADELEEYNHRHKAIKKLKLVINKKLKLVE